MITAQKQARVVHHALAQGSKLLENGLMHRLQRGKAISDDRDVPAKDFVVPMIYRTKKPAQTILPGPELLPIRSPHSIRMIRNNFSVVRPTGTIPLGSHGSKQIVSLHQPQIPLPASPDASPAQSNTNLLVSFAMERTLCQIFSNGHHQRFITDHWLWTRTLLGCLCSAGRIPRRGRQPGH